MNFEQYRKAWLLPVFIAVACSTTQRREVGDELQGSDEDRFEISDDTIGSSVDRGSFVHSLSNNRMTSRLVNTEKARAIVGKLSASKKGDYEETKAILAAIISAERLANAPITRLLEHAQRLADMELRRGVDNGIGDEVKLELALAGLKQRKFGLAIFFLEEILNSRNKRVRAGAYNAMGLLALNDGRIPEAVQYWRDALKAVPGYEASLLNLGFISLQYGAFGDAKKLLSRISNDWFAKSGRLIAARLTGDIGETSQLCAELLTKHGNHKPTVFNCGVHEWQSNNNIPKAKQLIGQALNMRGGPAAWDTRGYKTLESIR